MSGVDLQGGMGGVRLEGLEHLQEPLLGDQAGRLDEIGGMELPGHPGEAREEGARRLDNTNSFLRGLSAFAVGAAAVFRCLLAVGTLGISEAIAAGIGKLIENSGTKATPQDPISVTVPGTDEPVDLDASILPGRIASDMTAEDIQEAVQQKIDEGFRLVTDLNNDTHDGTPCTVEDMTNIMFFLQVKAEASKGSFESGAFTISDPGQRIHEFLSGCTQAYQRDSSHISDFQTLEGGSHRGIDAFGSGKDFSELLPHGRTTLLFGTLARNDDLQMPEDRLYLKIEPYGAWLFAPKVDNVDGPHRYGNFSDIGAAIGHSLSFLETRGQGSAAGTFKERVPSSVKNDFNELVETMPEDVKDTLLEGDPTNKSKGIRVMLSNVDRALDMVEAGSPEHTALTEFAESLMDQYDHSDMRFGNEIIFTADDITG